MRAHAIIVGVLSVCVADSLFAGDAKPAAKSPLISTGPLQKVRGPLERILQFRLVGSILSGQLQTRGEVVRIRLEEMQGPQRTLEFRDDGQGGLRIFVMHVDG